MRIISVLLLAATTCGALTVDIPPLDTERPADGEASVDVAIPPKVHEHLREVRIELTLHATVSNNVQIAFGLDTLPADGALAAEETAFILGWDSGAWFLRPAGLRERFEFAPADAETSRTRTLRFSMLVDARGAPITLTYAEDGGSFVLPSLAIPPFPPWLRPDAWNMLRVTSRGRDLATEDIDVRFLPDLTIIILR
jgi:hypothetical protein